MEDALEPRVDGGRQDSAGDGGGGETVGWIWRGKNFPILGRSRDRYLVLILDRGVLIRLGMGS